MNGSETLFLFLVVGGFAVFSATLAYVCWEWEKHCKG